MNVSNHKHCYLFIVQPKCEVRATGVYTIQFTLHSPLNTSSVVFTHSMQLNAATSGNSYFGDVGIYRRAYFIVNCYVINILEESNFQSTPQCMYNQKLQTYDSFCGGYNFYVFINSLCY